MNTKCAAGARRRASRPTLSYLFIFCPRFFAKESSALQRYKRNLFHIDIHPGDGPQVAVRKEPPGVRFEFVRRAVEGGNLEGHAGLKQAEFLLADPPAADLDAHFGFDLLRAA